MNSASNGSVYHATLDGEGMAQFDHSAHEQRTNVLQMYIENPIFRRSGRMLLSHNGNVVLGSKQCSLTYQ